MSLEHARATATFGHRLRALREARGWNQVEVGRWSGIHEKQISHWERRRSLPSYRSLLALADLFEIPLDELMRGRPPGNEG